MAAVLHQYIHQVHGAASASSLQIGALDGAQREVSGRALARPKHVPSTSQARPKHVPSTSQACAQMGSTAA